MGVSHSSLIPITRDDAQWVIGHPWHFNVIFTEQVIILAQAVFDVKFKGKLLWSTVWFFADTKNIYLMKQNKILWQLLQFDIESEFTSSSFWRWCLIWSTCFITNNIKYKQDKSWILFRKIVRLQTFVTLQATWEFIYLKKSCEILKRLPWERKKPRALYSLKLITHIWVGGLVLSQKWEIG